MSNNDDVTINSASNAEEISTEHLVATVIADLNTNIENDNHPNNHDSDDPTNINSSNQQRSTINGLLIEFQNLMAVACYQSVNTNTMKQNELCTKMHDELFSNSARVGHAEQLMKGEGPFGCMFDRVSVESHGLNTTTSTACKLKVKPMLMGGDSKTWCMEDNFTTEMLCKSSVGSSNKITSIFFSKPTQNR